MAGAIATYPNLRGRPVRVTGRGIGAAVPRRFAERGPRVGSPAIAVKSTEALAGELAREGDALRFAARDLRDIASLRAAVGAVRDAHAPVTLPVDDAAHDERHATPDVAPNLRRQIFNADEASTCTDQHHAADARWV